jgi:hypothetical protein
VRFQVLTAANVKFRVFWDVAPCSHVEVDRRFRGAYCLREGDDVGWSAYIQVHTCEFLFRISFVRNAGVLNLAPEFYFCVSDIVLPALYRRSGRRTPLSARAHVSHNMKLLQTLHLSS